MDVWCAAPIKQHAEVCTNQFCLAIYMCFVLICDRRYMLSVCDVGLIVSGKFGKKQEVMINLKAGISLCGALPPRHIHRERKKANRFLPRKHTPFSHSLRFCRL